MTLPLDQIENVEKFLHDEYQNAVKRRRWLLILLLIKWVVFLFILGTAIRSVSSGNTADAWSGFQSLIPYIGFIIHLTFGLIVTYKAHRAGLLIFASIGIVLFISVCLFLGSLSLAVVTLSIGFGDSADELYPFYIFIGLVFAVIATIAITSIKLSIDLAKSIKLNEHAII